MPTGKVRWFDQEKGFGFILGDDGTDVFVPAAALPPHIRTLNRSAKVEYSVVEGRKGPQAMNVTLVQAVPSLVKANRPDAEDMVAIVEDLMKMLESVGETLRRHRYPSAKDGRQLAALLRGVADNFDVQE